MADAPKTETKPEAEAQPERTESAKLHIQEYHGVCHWGGSQFDKMADFKCRSDDVWVCSFPRSGTTLTQQIVYLIMTLDFEKAVNVDLDDRFPFAELKSDDFPYFRGLEYLDKLPEDQSRMIKSHAHYFLLPNELKRGKGKIVYITRNPKSSVPSLYKVLHYIKNPPAPSLEAYIEMFISGKEIYSGPWGRHVREYWDQRDDEHILFLQFEKLVKDRKGTIKRIANFLGRDLTDEQINKVYEYTTLESMKTNNSVNFMYFENLYFTDDTEGKFINKGEVAGWKNDIPEDLAKRFDEYIKREVGGTDIKYE